MENIKPKKEMTQIEIALFWVNHIENPCEDNEGHNLRQTYIDAAKTHIIPTLKDPTAKKILELVLRKYNK